MTCVPGATQHEAISGFTRVFDALWRSDALQTRDPGYFTVKKPGSRICAAPLRAAARAGHA